MRCSELNGLYNRDNFSERDSQPITHFLELLLLIPELWHSLGVTKDCLRLPPTSPMREEVKIKIKFDVEKV